MFGHTGSGRGRLPGRMSVVPGGIDADQQPPMTVPLRHFLVGLGSLVAGALLGVGLLVGVPLSRAPLVHVHLLLVGWVCVTIMGAMTQFVPVWSGVDLHSRRLANWQLRLVVAGLLGFVAALATGWLAWTPVFGVVMLAGFWTFVYNVARTLPPAREMDVTERHFAAALAFFVAVTALGPLLALDLTTGVLAHSGLTHGGVLRTHATLAVFGAVLTTVLGALYQLGTMFTQTELHGVDLPLRRLEEAVYPSGVLLLAAGRLLDGPTLATVGGVLVLAGLAAFAVVLARKLYEMQVAWTPMHRRYAVVAPALLLWVAVTVPAWLRDPLAASTVFGAERAGHLLLLGVVGFVVFGTLYHIVPFVVWVHRYSDRLGFESVPMIDDLYDDRVAAADFLLLLAGSLVVVAWEAGLAPRAAGAVGGGLVTCGVVLFVANVGLVVHRHSPQSPAELLVGVSIGRGGDPEADPERQASE
jgi:hypothetical protein